MDRTDSLTDATEDASSSHVSAHEHVYLNWVGRLLLIRIWLYPSKDMAFMYSADGSRLYRSVRGDNEGS